MTGTKEIEFSKLWHMNPNFPEDKPKHKRRMRISSHFHASRADAYVVAEKTGLAIATVLRYVNLWSINPRGTTGDDIADAIGLTTIDYFKGKVVKRAPSFNSALREAQRIAAELAKGNTDVKIKMSVTPKRLRPGKRTKRKAKKK